MYPAELTLACSDGLLRLGNRMYGYDDEGRLIRGGRVELCHNDTYHPVCYEGWTNNDATVFCYGLGYRLPYYRKLLNQSIFSLNILKKNRWKGYKPCRIWPFPKSSFSPKSYVYWK